MATQAAGFHFIISFPSHLAIKNPPQQYKLKTAAWVANIFGAQNLEKTKLTVTMHAI